MGITTFGANGEFTEDAWDAIPVDDEWGEPIRQYGRADPSRWNYGNNPYPLLKANLRERTSSMMRKCMHSGTAYVYSGTTALRLLGVEAPEDLKAPGGTWDDPPRPQRDDCLDVVVRTDKDRRAVQGVRMHVWKALDDSCVQLLTNGVQCLKPTAAWAAVTREATKLQLIQIAESMERYGLAALDELEAFVRKYRFHGKSRCQLALAIAKPGSASVKETELRVRLELRGISGFSINCTVFGSAYDTGVEHTLDLALEKYRVGLEYQGDQHSSDYRQYRRDRDKRGALAALGWQVFEVTQDDLNSEDAVSRLAMRIMCVIASRAGEQPHIARLTYARIADGRRRK